jgi:2-hydroxychromene-2-carboxylate isomerase
MHYFWVMSARMTFWFEFASTYSYLTVMRIEALARERCVEVEWKPFLLGPIFAAQGWTTSPFNLYPAKGAYMWRDIERRAAGYGIPFRPWSGKDGRIFPQNGLLAARTATAALRERWGKEFVRRVYSAQFANGLDISNPKVIGDCIKAAGGNEQMFLHLGHSNTHKQVLRENTDAAIATGVFGAPSFTIGPELFWGDDRLEDALNWALSRPA